MTPLTLTVSAGIVMSIGAMMLFVITPPAIVPPSITKVSGAADSPRVPGINDIAFKPRFIGSGL